MQRFRRRTSHPPRWHAGRGRIGCRHAPTPANADRSLCPHYAQRVSGMITLAAEYEPLIRPLFQLANTPMEPTSFRAACQSFGELDASSSFDDLWWFRCAPRLALMVSVDVYDPPVKIRFAVLSFCWWESEHGVPEVAGAEQFEFDQTFVTARNRTVDVLGAPLLQGRDADDQGHRWAIWRGATGLLVLQQSSYDPQFGVDVNFWVCPWTEPDVEPLSPLIDWLTSH